MSLPLAVQYANQQATVLSQSGVGAGLSMRDRFRGAMLGLGLVAIALDGIADASGPSSGYAKSTVDGIATRVALNILRYCSYRPQRKQSLVQTLGTRATDYWVPCLVAGDWIEPMVNAKAGEMPIDIERRLSQYSFSAQQRSDYQDIHALLQRAVQRSYAHSVRTAAADIVVSLPIESDVMPKDMSEAIARRQIILSLVGFVAGMHSGVSRLPILWQMTLGQKPQEQKPQEQCRMSGGDLRSGEVGSSGMSRDEALQLADRTYAQWAGVLNKRHFESCRVAQQLIGSGSEPGDYNL